MKSLFLFINILLIINTCFSQTWSEPKIVSSLGLNGSADFTIDKDGILHCVWARKFADYFIKIYYSKSMDNGDTWTNPVPITTNSDLWLDDPHIVADTSGNLYVSYDYDVYNWPKTKICYVKFDIHDSTWSQQTTLGTGMANRLIVDLNNRVYFFWYAGTEYYVYLDNNVLSDPIAPGSGNQIPCYFDNLKVDKKNNIHCIGNRKAGDHAHGAYFSCFNGIWTHYIDLSNESFFEGSVDLNSLNAPSFAWRQVMTDSLENVRGTYYFKAEWDSVNSPLFLDQNTSYPVLAIDINDKPHIVESQSVDEGSRLIHHYISGDSWQSELLDYNKNWYNENVLISRNSCIYLIYNKIDTIINPPTHSYYGMIVFRKLKIATGIVEDSQKPACLVYPNPFSEKVIVELPKRESKSIIVNIFNMQGIQVYTESFSDQSATTNRFVWDGKDNLGKQVEEGFYLIQLSAGSQTIVKTVIRLN